MISKIGNRGYWVLRSGGGHDIYTNGKKIIAIPRHREINEMLAKKIIKEAGVEKLTAA